MCAYRARACARWSSPDSPLEGALALGGDPTEDHPFSLLACFIIFWLQVPTLASVSKILNQIIMTTFRSAYSDHDPAQYFTAGGGKSKTQQQFAEDADVNNILKRCVRTGVVDAGVGENPPEHLFADVVHYQALDYQQALDMITEAEEEFMSLPAAVRRRYEDNPIKFLQAINDGDEYLYEAGLATRKENSEEKKEAKADDDTAS